MIIPASVISDEARNTGNRILLNLAENVPEIAPYIGHLLELAEGARASSKKIAVAARDERIRWVRNQTWPHLSDRRAADKIRKVALALRPDQTPRSEPEVSVRKILEFNGGKVPSDRTIREALRN